MLAGLAAAPAAHAAGPGGGRFGVSGDRFTLDGEPFQIRSGEMHYARVPRSCWADRLRKVRALGLNTVSTYAFWNAHERSPGVFDFSGRLDAAAFVRLAQSEGLHVLLRPGPYGCGEWDGGGLPAWLERGGPAPVRTRDPAFLAAAGRWLSRLGQELAGLEIDRGGPILMTQVENEYGSFGEDPAYMAAIRDRIRAAGFRGTLYTADGAAVLGKGAIPGVVAGIDFAATDDAAKEFAAFDSKRPGAPRFCSEIWTGWFDHFGETHQTVATAPLLKNLDWMIAHGASFSLYMVHGGTSFGFDAGANFDREAGRYQPDISSYDYDALLDEAGRPTAKYLAVRALLARTSSVPPPPLPPPEAVAQVAPVAFRERASLDQLFGPERAGASPLAFPALGLPHGLARYRCVLPERARAAALKVEVADYARVSVGGRLQGALDRSLGQTEIAITGQAGEVLEVLVMALGRINYGERLGRDPKGLLGDPTLAGAPLRGWRHAPVALDDLSSLAFSAEPVQGPAFHRAVFRPQRPGYAFIDLRGWGRGYAWLNGRNLGRFWTGGPQRRLFAPAEAFVEGDNTLVVLDLDTDGSRLATFAPDPLWDTPATVPGAV